MTSLAWLIPIALFLGGLGLAAFLWSLREGQFDDLDGASWRALDDRALDSVNQGSENVTRRTSG
jgi:cbb3-type cytochrome oxidase maturation protein